MIHLAHVMLLLAATWPAAGPDPDSAPRRRVHVSAKSEVKVVPDEVLVALSIVSRNTDLMKAKADNDGTTRAVLGLAKPHEIPLENFKITNLSLSPEYDNQRKFLGYDVSRALEITLHDFSKLEPLLADLVKAGVDFIESVTFRLRDQGPALIEARRLAVCYAQEKATRLAELNGLQRGKAISIQEHIQRNENVGGLGGMMGFATQPPGEENLLDPALGPRARRVHTVSERRTPDPQAEPKGGGGGDGARVDPLLAPGQLTIELDVSIEFELRKP